MPSRDERPIAAPRHSLGKAGNGTEFSAGRSYLPETRRPGIRVAQRCVAPERGSTPLATRGTQVSDPPRRTLSFKRETCFTTTTHPASEDRRSEGGELQVATGSGPTHGLHDHSYPSPGHGTGLSSLRLLQPARPRPSAAPTGPGG